MHKFENISQGEAHTYTKVKGLRYMIFPKGTRSETPLVWVAPSGSLYMDGGWDDVTLSMIKRPDDYDIFVEIIS